MNEALTLDEVELRIFEIYQFFSREAPGVTPQEVGELGDLWRIADEFYAEDGNEIA